MNAQNGTINRNPLTLWLLCLGSGVLSGPLMVDPVLKYLSGSSEGDGDGRTFCMVCLIIAGVYLGFKAVELLQESYCTSPHGWVWAWAAAFLIPWVAAVIVVLAMMCAMVVLLFLGLVLYSISSHDDYYYYY